MFYLNMLCHSRNNQIPDYFQRKRLILRLRNLILQHNPHLVWQYMLKQRFCMHHLQPDQLEHYHMSYPYIFLYSKSMLHLICPQRNQFQQLNLHIQLPIQYILLLLWLCIQKAKLCRQRQMLMQVAIQDSRQHLHIQGWLHLLCSSSNIFQKHSKHMIQKSNRLSMLPFRRILLHLQYIWLRLLNILHHHHRQMVCMQQSEYKPCHPMRKGSSLGILLLY
ncbi:unnamed protein product [Paramecium octaurelia]|uniref:Uncharacterized protein n=1 Tax=Paramecium octaurelia TaxID=43137 RepID=A0A8S1YF71_PAROT|nr:unnamed protein product [Paramecium octaurelia]